MPSKVSNSVIVCGIVAYLGPKSVESVLLVGLMRLEYRGYDSAGIAIFSEDEIVVQKTVGKIRTLTELLAKKPLYGNIGIAHTRWATHGEVTRKNAHPQTDTQEEIAIVHNGIIENHAVLRKELLAKKHFFRSETDTEVIPHLIAEYIKQGKSVTDAFHACICRLQGSYSLAMICKQAPDKVYFARDGISLVVGRAMREDSGSGKVCEYMIASDKPAMATLVDDAMVIDNGRWGWVDAENGVNLFDYERMPKGCDFQKIVHQESDAFDRGDYAHFMLKEIHEQSQVIERIMQRRVDAKGVIQFEEVSLPPKHLVNLNRVITISAGSSWHAALIGKMYLERLARISVEVDLASEFRYNNPILMGDTQVIALSQSGETADTIASIFLAKSKFMPVLALVNNMDSTIARDCDAAIDLLAGLEIGVASTKAYTAQLVNLLLYAMFLGIKKQILNPEKIESLILGLQKLPEAIQNILERKHLVQELAGRLSQEKDVIFLARSWNHSTALEGALKLKEISYIHASGYAAGEFKHGPIALISEGMPVVCIANHEDGVYEKMISNIEEVRSRKGKIIAIITEGDQKIKSMVDYYFEIPRCLPEISPVLNIIPLQLFAYYMALARGCEPDQPRNLAKSVTVE